MRIVQKSIVADRADSNITAIAGSLTLTPGTAAVTYTPEGDPPSGLPVYTPNKFVTISATGSGDGSDAGANAWTLEQAVDNAVAGDVVQVGPGDYTKTDTAVARHHVVWNPANSGIEGQPIVFFAQNRSGTTYQAGVTSRLGRTGGSGPVLGVGADAQSRSWITFDGFMVDEKLFSTESDTGPVVIWHGGGSRAVGVKLLSLVVLGDTAGWTDNHVGIRVEGTERCVVRDCYIDGIWTSGGANANPNNVIGIQTYSSQNLEIDHNTIVRTSGIHIKESRANTGGFEVQYGVSVHHNFVDGTGYVNPNGNAQGIRMTSLNATIINKVYQNILINAGGYDVSRAAEQHDGIYVCNNTIYNPGYAVGAGWTATAGVGADRSTYTFRNNIISNVNGASMWSFGNEWTEAQLLTFGPFDYNIWGAYPDWYDGDGGPLGSYTYADFKAAGQEANSPASFNGASDPQINFANIGGSNPEDYKLAVGSIGLNAATDFLNLLGGGTSAPINCGAYILPDQSDQIGRRTA